MSEDPLLLACDVARLTLSERCVVLLAAQGRSYPEIAEELEISVHAVAVHASRARRKLLALEAPPWRQVGDSGRRGYTQRSCA